MKKLILIFVVLMMVAGATVSVLNFLQLGPFAPDENAAKTEEQPLAELGEMIDLNPFNISIFEGDRVAGNIQISIKIEVKKELAPGVKERQKRLENLFLQDLYVFLPRLMRNREQIDLLVLKNRLKKISAKVVGDEAIMDVLIQGILDNPQ